MFREIWQKFLGIGKSTMNKIKTTNDKLGFKYQITS